MTIASGDETQINAVSQDKQQYKRVAVLEDGGWVVTWTSTLADNTDVDTLQQAYNADGTKRGVETMVNTYSRSTQGLSDIAGLKDGGWVVTWTSLGQERFGYEGIYQQVYNADGTARGVETQVSTPLLKYARNAAITALSDGGWVVSYESILSSGYKLSQQAYNADGTQRGAYTEIDTETTYEQLTQQTVELSDGGWVITWLSQRTISKFDIRQQVFNADGTARGAAINISDPEDIARDLQVTVLQDGGWIVCWGDRNSGGLHYLAYNADGTARGPATEISGTTGTSLKAVALADGGWALTWTSSSGWPSGYHIFQQVYNADGTTRGGQTEVNTSSLSSNFGSQGVVLSDGGWVILWADSEHIYQQAYNADGTADGTEIVIQTPYLFASQLKITALPDNGWIVTWINDDIQQRTFWKNDAPTVTGPIGAGIATEDQPFLNIILDKFVDADVLDTLTYTATMQDGSALPDWLTFDPTTRKLSGTPGNGDTGFITIKVTATDKAGASVSAEYALWIDPVNDAPTVVNAIPDKIVSKDSFLSIDLAAGVFQDIDSTLTYTATLADGSDLPEWLSYDIDTHILSGTPANDDVGTMTIRVTATDPDGAAISTEFTLEVTNTNDAPVLANSLPTQNLLEDFSFVYRIPEDAFADVDAGDTLTYSATFADTGTLPDWLTFDAETRTLSGAPTNDYVGVITIKITATDSSGASATADLDLSIGNTNDAPTVVGSISDQVVTLGDFYQMNIVSVFEDVDLPGNDVLTYTATLANGDPLPGWLSLTASGLFQGAPVSGYALGPVTVRVTATDMSGAHVSTDFTLTLNDKPVVANEIAGRTATEDQAFSFTVPADTFDDQVLDTLTYSATLDWGGDLPSWLTFNAATRTFSGTPANGDVGEITIRLTATDAAGAAVSTYFTLGVTNTNDAPTLPSNGTASVFENAKLTLDVLANAVDVDAGSTLTITSASVRSGFGSVFIQDGKLVYDPTTAPNQDIAVGGTRPVIIRYTVSDGKGGTATTDIAVTVKGVSPDIIKGGSGNDTLSGSSLRDELYGYAGNDTLDGKAGADKMVGGAGTDTYVVDNTGDTVTELANEGTDTIKASVSYTLSANVEHLTLTGTGKINATGNELANTLTGNDTDNTLDGKAGADRLVGLKGNDTYIVDNTGDVVVEAAGQGIDQVMSSISYTLASNVEAVTLTGTGKINATGNGFDNVLDGNGADNVLDGKAGADLMRGGKGNDTYVVDNASDLALEAANQGTDLVKSSISYTILSNTENLTLTGTGKISATGNELANTLTGNDADNTLDGKAGADRLVGLRGNDTYVVDNSKDVVVEASGQGTDLVKSSVSYTLAANVEHLTLTGTAKISATGNELANVLTGNDADNTLDGKAGADRLVGLKGNDTYVVDNAKDVVVEASGQGTDLVKSSVSYTLSANVENLMLTGLGKITATGNELANALTGNGTDNILDGKAGNDTLKGEGGNDRLLGGLGADRLYGGAGSDTFIFKAKAETTVASSGMDMIYDFSRSQGDRIDLSAIDANEKLSGNQGFTLIGTDGFHKKAGELRYETKSGDTYVYGDVDGDGKADFAIRFDAQLAFKTGDFLL